MREIKSVLKLEEKYWWDAKNKILYRSNFDIEKNNERDFNILNIRVLFI